MRARLSILLALSGACACPASFPRPYHKLTTGDSVCNSNIVLDARRQVWTESGCELTSSGWKVERTATETESARVESAFALLPPAGQGCPAAGDGGFQGPPFHTLSVTADQGQSAWSACRDPDGGIAAPFAEAVSAMQALTAQ